MNAIVPRPPGYEPGHAPGIFRPHRDLTRMPNPIPTGLDFSTRPIFKDPTLVAPVFRHYTSMCSEARKDNLYLLPLQSQDHRRFVVQGQAVMHAAICDFGTDGCSYAQEDYLSCHLQVVGSHKVQAAIATGYGWHQSFQTGPGYIDGEAARSRIFLGVVGGMFWGFPPHERYTVGFPSIKAWLIPTIGVASSGFHVWAHLGPPCSGWTNNQPPSLSETTKGSFEQLVRLVDTQDIRLHGRWRAGSVVVPEGLLDTYSIAGLEGWGTSEVIAADNCAYFVLQALEAGYDLSRDPNEISAPGGPAEIASLEHDIQAANAHELPLPDGDDEELNDGGNSPIVTIPRPPTPPPLPIAPPPAVPPPPGFKHVNLFVAIRMRRLGLRKIATTPSA